MQGRHPTATRIIEAALALFADHGLEATPIVRIEEAAGLSPGSGSFYKHFRSKAEILRAAREDMTAAIPDAGAALDEMSDLDVDQQLRLIGAGMLAMYDSQRNLVLAGLRLPPDHDLLEHGAGVSTSAAGIDWFEGWIHRTAKEHGVTVTNPRATALLLLGGIFSFWLSEQLREGDTLGVDRSQLVEAWANVALAALGIPHPAVEQ